MSNTPDPEIQISVKGVTKSYEKGLIQVLRGIDLEIRAGDTVALCGPSGGGKSTLLHLIAGIDSPDDGSITIDGKSLESETNRNQMLRNTIGFVFQLHNLIPDLSLEENCMIPAVAAGKSRKEARERLLVLAERIGIQHRLKNKIQDLSGGERQRTAICRALMNSPKIIIADEPTGALDEENRNIVLELLLELVAEEDATLVMATHDHELAALCQRTLTVKDGLVL